jgi:3-dehydroquinate synthase
MSVSFDVSSSVGAYGVHVESRGFDKFVEKFDQPLVLADEFFRSRLSNNSSTIFAEANEEFKSLDACPSLIEAIRKSGAGRGTHLVAVGGGVIQDVSAFIASIYMRGLQWSYIPTTVLAMVDSCIGGKSSINVGRYKNLVGTFHPPTEVLIDPAVAMTLPEHEQAAGLVEAAKICFCRGANTFEQYLSSNPAPNIPTESLEQVIAQSLLAKKWFIEIDEFDKKERLLLNFGHTFGHAIEGASHFSISHGIAVGLGIVCALEFQRQRGVDYSAAPHVGRLEDHLRHLIATVPDLAEHLKVLHCGDLNDIIERFESDKKHSRENFSLILVSEAGEVGLQKISKTEDNRTLVKRSIKSVLGRYAG